jgi:hypothetical protein
MKIALATVVLVALAALAPPTLALASAPSSTTALIDITETDAHGKPTTSKIETVVVLDRGTSQIDTTVDGARTQIDLAWRSDRGAGPILDLDFQQERERKKTRFEVRARVASGKRAVLTDVTRSDGSRFTLAVTLR